MHVGNIFANAGPPASGEIFEELLSHRNLTVERIVSSEWPNPAEYRQEHDEWVLLVQGSAELDVGGEIVALEAGDYLFLPAGSQHSVRRTSSGAIWLAIHLLPAANDGGSASA